MASGEATKMNILVSKALIIIYQKFSILSTAYHSRQLCEKRFSIENRRMQLRQTMTAFIRSFNIKYNKKHAQKC